MYKTVLRLVLWLAYRGLLVFWTLFGGRGRGVTIVLRHAGRILLVETSYRRGLELPGGGRKRGETAPQAAARELREELDLAIDECELRILLEHVFTKNRRRIEETILFAELREPPLLAPDQIEIIHADFYSSADIVPKNISLIRALQQLR